MINLHATDANIKSNRKTNFYLIVAERIVIWTMKLLSTAYYEALYIYKFINKIIFQNITPIFFSLVSFFESSSPLHTESTR